MKKIKLNDDEKIKGFFLHTPEKVEIVYKEMTQSIYAGIPGHWFACVKFNDKNEPLITMERLN